MGVAPEREQTILYITVVIVIISFEGGRAFEATRVADLSAVQVDIFPSPQTWNHGERFKITFFSLTFSDSSAQAEYGFVIGASEP